MRGGRLLPVGMPPSMSLHHRYSLSLSHLSLSLPLSLSSRQQLGRGCALEQQDLHRHRPRLHGHAAAATMAARTARPGGLAGIWARPRRPGQYVERTGRSLQKDP
jgi:hypothetical protein